MYLFLQASVPSPSSSAALEEITIAREEAATVMNSAMWYQTAAQTTVPSATVKTHMQVLFHPWKIWML